MAEKKTKIKIKLKEHAPITEIKATKIDPESEREFQKAAEESVMVPYPNTIEDLKRIESKIDGLTEIMKAVKAMLEEAKAKTNLDFLKKF